MDIYKLYRDFWDFAFENPEKIKPNHIAVFSFAIEHCNRLGWKKKYGFPTAMAMDAVGIKSYNTYISALNDLVEFGFIQMIEKSKNQFSANIIALSKFDKALDKALDKATLKHVSKQHESTVQSTSESTIQSIDSVNKPIYQSTTIPIYQSTINNAETSSAVIENEIIETETISFEEPKTEKKEKKGSAEKKESPFMNQCKQVFLDYYTNNRQKYIWKPMDDKALGGVISQLKKSLTNDKNEQPSAEKVIDLLKVLLNKLPEWYKQNANSVSNINASYNNIINQIKNERTKKQPIGDAVADIMSKYYRKEG